MSRILLVHGWSFDASFWADVVGILPDHECHMVDHGYYGPPQLAIPEGLDLVVGHSFGCLWAMKNPELQGVPLVAINGFTRFSAAPDFPHGVPVRMLSRMLQRFGEDPGEILKSFRERCGVEPSPGSFDRARLAADLERLRDEDARGATAPRLALAAADDPLVAVEMSQQAFPANLRCLPTGGHLLPLTTPKAVAQVIREGLTP